MQTNYLIRALIALAALILPVGAQQFTSNKVDQTLRGESRINPTSLGMEFEIPISTYPGRGIDMPISLNYSSKVWRLSYGGSIPAVNNPDTCNAINTPRFAENSASGWTASLSVPYVEYTGGANIYNSAGDPAEEPGCAPEPGGSNNNAWVRRIFVHLPGGESHELRMMDPVLFYPASSNCDPDPQTLCDGNDPSHDYNWNGWYYAADGSNIRYFEDRGSGVFYLQMPDGSRYEFTGQIGGSTTAQIRKASKLVDRNGNTITYHGPNQQFPNGYLTDTIGRQLPIPLPASAPTEPKVETVQFPGIAGSQITYRLHWKRLKGSTADESALANFNDGLRFAGDRYLQGGVWQTRNSGESLFASEFESWVLSSESRFNPVVLAAVELPSGRSFRFRYNIHGEIVRTDLATGGFETYQIEPVNAITDLAGPHRQANRGITSRVLAESTSGASYEWRYSTSIDDASTYRSVTTNPDGSQLTKLVHRGGSGRFGFDSALSGMTFEEYVHTQSSMIVSMKRTNWSFSTRGIFDGESPVSIAEWHPRISSIESTTFDVLGRAAKAVNVMTYESETELGQPSTPVLVKKVDEFDFVPGNQPTPELPIRSTVNTFLINDQSIDATIRETYRNLNLVNLMTSIDIRDGAGNLFARSETKFDESGMSPSIGRGNPTSTHEWNSESGSSTNPGSYVVSRTRFDGYGNTVEFIDPLGRSTTTEFDPVSAVYPIRVTTPVPDPTGIKGSATSHVSLASFDPATGLQLSSIDPAGLETRMYYDPSTLRINAIRFYVNDQPIGGSTETVYGDGDDWMWIRERSEFDAEKWNERITRFDGLGRIRQTETSNSAGNVLVDQEYDDAGRLRRTSNPYRSGETPQWTTHEYDEIGRQKKIVHPDGSEVSTDWGVLVSDLTATTRTVTDQAGKKRRGVFDSLGRLKRVVEDPDGLNLVTDYVLDAGGNVRKTIQGGQFRYYAYSSIGRLIYSALPELDVNDGLEFTDSLTGNSRWSNRYEYDLSGNIIRTTDARGNQTTITYDGLNRVVARDFSDATPDVSFYFDGTGIQSAPAFATGKMTRVSSPISDVRYQQFDAFGRIKSVVQTIDGTSFESGYTYNLAGELVAETYPSGRTVMTDRNADGGVDSIRTSNSTVQDRTVASRFAYDPTGAVRAVRLGNGRWEQHTFNNRQQLTRSTLGYSVSDGALLDIGLGYGAQNNGAVRTQSIKFQGLAAPIEQTFDYDTLNRIKSARETQTGQQSWSQEFLYDRYGNRRLGAATSTLSILLDDKIENPVAEESSNRLKRDQDGDSIIDYRYDASGNMIADPSNRRFNYDSENRLTEVFQPSNSSSVPNIVYRYDGDGRRVLKLTSDEKVIFVYNVRGKLTAEYSTRITSEPKKTLFLTNDSLGSPRVITDGAGNVASRHDYLAFGEDITATLGNVGGRTTNHGYVNTGSVRQAFTGFVRDSETGLDFANARYFKPGHGRFVSVDPLIASASFRDPQTLNRYTYALNSPYKFVDPLGLISRSTGANGGSSDTRPRRPRRPRPAPRNLTPNPNVVVPRSIVNEAGASTVGGTANRGAVTIVLPKSLVTLKVELAKYTYSHIGAAQSQAQANKKFGAVQPEQATVSGSSETTTQSSSTSETTGSVTVSQQPEVTASSSQSTTAGRQQTNSGSITVTGASTDVRGVYNTVENETNLAITNYLNENADANGNISVTLIDKNNVQTKGVIDRETVKKHLTNLVQSAWQRAYFDFGGQ